VVNKEADGLQLQFGGMSLGDNSRYSKSHHNLKKNKARLAKYTAVLTTR